MDIPQFTPKEEPKVEEVKEEPKVEEVTSEPEYAKILREHGYLESNIPINSHYWKIRP